MLADRTIREYINNGEISIWPVPERWQFQTVSVDLRLGSIMDAEEQLWLTGEDGDQYYMLQPGEFMLGSTFEGLKLSRNVVGVVHGKSTRARQGLIVHAAGLVDPGFYGQLTLECFNMSKAPIMLERSMLICQVTFESLSTTPDRAYGHPELFSRYQGQTGPTPAMNGRKST